MTGGFESGELQSAGDLHTWWVTWCVTCCVTWCEDRYSKTCVYT